MTVVKHGPIGYARVIVGKVLEILVMGGYDSPGPFFEEQAQYTLGDGSAYIRFGAGTKLVYQYRGLAIGLPEHVLHIEQMRRIGRQVVFQALLVADVYHYI